MGEIAVVKNVRVRAVDVGLFMGEKSVKPSKRNWVPASGGTETPFKSRSGVTLLYCWNEAENRHAYLNCDTDEIVSNQEAEAYLGMV